MTLDIIFFAIGIPRNNDVTMVSALYRITVLIRTFSGNALFQQSFTKMWKWNFVISWNF